MRVAIVHDWLTSYGGAEKVLKAITEIFPSAPIYTLVYNKKTVEKIFGQENKKIFPSFIQHIPFSTKIYRNLLVLFPLAIESLDLREYDLIISTSHSVAKGVLKRADQFHISYIHTPVRYAWDMYHDYLELSDLKTGVKGFLAQLILHYIRIWDYISSQRVDFFIANSQTIAKRIKSVYGKEAVVIYPPVDLERFLDKNPLSIKKENFFLTVSRLVQYKRVDLIIEAFNKIGEKLVVVGDGPDYKKLKSIAKKNIVFTGEISDEELTELFLKARAFVYCAFEDFGISPVEAQAAGTPVIALGKGGTSETVINNITGILFPEQNLDSLLSAIKQFLIQEPNFSREKILENAKRFSKQRFIQEFSTLLKNLGVL